MIVFKCTFQGDYSSTNLDAVNWEVTFQNGTDIIIERNSSDYHIIINDCPYTNSPCCQFTIELYVNTSLELNNAMMNCTAIYDSVKSTNASNLSKLSNMLHGSYFH